MSDIYSNNKQLFNFHKGDSLLESITLPTILTSYVDHLETQFRSSLTTSIPLNLIWHPGLSVGFFSGGDSLHRKNNQPLDILKGCKRGHSPLLLHFGASTGSTVRSVSRRRNPPSPEVNHRENWGPDGPQQSLWLSEASPRHYVAFVPAEVNNAGDSAGNSEILYFLISGFPAWRRPHISP